MNRKLTVLAFAALSLFCAGARATVPQNFSVQGVLRDKSGALQSTTATVVVNFFAAAMAMPGEKPLNATPITLTGVGVTNGLFTINVPLTSDLANTFANPQVWLEMTVNSDTFPRQQVTPDVYSLMCGTADVANSLSAALANPTWIPLPLSSGWSPFANGYNDPAYYKDPLGWVHVKGLVQNGTGTIAVLPAGYRPAQQYLTIAMAAQGGAHTFGRIDVHADGSIVVGFPNGAIQWISLDQLYFKAQ
jgi:hypothetical protein